MHQLPCKCITYYISLFYIMYELNDFWCPFSSHCFLKIFSWAFFIPNLLVASLFFHFIIFFKNDTSSYKIIWWVIFIYFNKLGTVIRDLFRTKKMKEMNPVNHFEWKNNHGRYANTMKLILPPDTFDYLFLIVLNEWGFKVRNREWED